MDILDDGWNLLKLAGIFNFFGWISTCIVQQVVSGVRMKVGVLST